jgi:YD repeat-containing protein
MAFGGLGYGEPNAVSNAVDYAKFRSRSHNAVIRVYDEAGNVIERTNTRAISRTVSRFHRSFLKPFLLPATGN